MKSHNISILSVELISHSTKSYPKVPVLSGATYILFALVELLDLITRVLYCSKLSWITMLQPYTGSPTIDHSLEGSNYTSIASLAPQWFGSHITGVVKAQTYVYLLLPRMSVWSLEERENKQVQSKIIIINSTLQEWQDRISLYK